MPQTTLAFLLGGYPAFEPAADAFVAACGGPDSRIALLSQHADRSDRPWESAPSHSEGRST